MSGLAGGRRSLLGGAALLLGCTARSGATGPIATPLTLEPLPAGSMLEALGGLLLDDETIGFGGFSAVHLDPDLRLTAISDMGHWLTARLVLREGRPQALKDPSTGPLRDGAGEPLTRGRMGDAESLARLPDGSWLVGFERWHRIRAFTTIDGPGRFVEAPPGLERAPGNQGLESLAVLADGSWLAITEALAIPDRPELVRAWLGGPGRWRPIVYQAGDGFRPVDAAPLPDGGALVLERSFTLLGGFNTRLVRLSAAMLRGAGEASVVRGEDILSLAPPHPIDNYEGVSVVRHDGRLLVALLSDDNQSMLQRSLLLLFAFREG